MTTIEKISHWSGVIWRGLKRLPENLRVPPPPFETSPLKPGTIQIVVYFADWPVNLYQLRQWYAPLQQLNKILPVAIFTRRDITAKELANESGLPVAQMTLIKEIEEELAKQPVKIVLYVNQNTRNFQMMRFEHVAHVFISHGESDKKYMSSNQLKAYDFTFVAGEAAKQRLSNSLNRFDVDERTKIIGRPQTDFLWSAPPYPADERINVIYAPTWEGDRNSMMYGSVLSHGVKLSQYILNNPKYRLIYRPHPRSGIFNERYAEANQQIIYAIENANIEDPSAQHLFDESPELSWQISQPQVMITDVSAMLYDRLAVGKPVLVTKPVEPEAVIDPGYLDHCEWLTSNDNLEQRLAYVLSAEESHENLKKWSHYYFGDSTKQQTPLFIEAVREVIRIVDSW